MRKTIWFFFATFVLALLGQSAELNGLVKDPSGSAVPKASVEIRNQDTGIRQQTKTNVDGLYSFPSLKPGCPGERIQDIDPGRDRTGS